MLADIVETLVENDVTAKKSFKTFAQTELQWRTRAMTIGAKYGLSERKVQGDFETDQITLLSPIQEKQCDEAAIYIQQMVGAAGECHVSDNYGGLMRDEQSKHEERIDVSDWTKKPWNQRPHLSRVRL